LWLSLVCVHVYRIVLQRILATSYITTILLGGAFRLHIKFDDESKAIPRNTPWRPHIFYTIGSKIAVKLSALRAGQASQPGIFSAA
jgi:hypothetical protein